jgi:hypothetical protein
MKIVVVDHLSLDGVMQPPGVLLATYQPRRNAK